MQYLIKNLKPLYVFLIVFYFIPIKGKTQNLVPNPSFEDTIHCPNINFGNLIDNSLNWFSGRNSPNYFNSCVDDSIAIFDTPTNGFGFQFPASGEAYGGFCTYGNPTGGSENYREFIQTQLSSPTVIGVKYFVSLKISRATNGFYYNTNWATNNIGALFTTSAYYSLNSDPLPNFCHVFTTSVISDTLNWTTILGSIIADSNYSFVSFGNFFDAINTLAISIGPISLGAYYYIDDVCISTDSLYCADFLNFIPIHDIKKVKLFPNPVNNELIINSVPMNVNILIYNSRGQIVYSKYISEDKSETTINTEQFSNGLFLLKINKSSNSSKYFKFIVNH